MKSLVIYYSHYGNTSFAVYYLLRKLEKRGSAEIMSLEYTRGQRNPALRLLYKFVPAIVELKPVVRNLHAYDILCLGIPVIGGRPSSAIAKYISICQNLGKKTIICCYVYGFEGNAKRCSEYVRRMLNKKTKSPIIEIFVPWNSARNDKELDAIMDKVLANLPANRKD